MKVKVTLFLPFMAPKDVPEVFARGAGLPALKEKLASINHSHTIHILNDSAFPAGRNLARKINGS
jgi:hypothetical protein